MIEVEERSLVITAMGEPGSVFLEKCAPIILHRSFRPVNEKAEDQPQAPATTQVFAKDDDLDLTSDSIFMLPEEPVQVRVAPVEMDADDAVDALTLLRQAS